MLKFIDCFSGVGGFHIGITNAVVDARCILAIEKDKYCQQSYVQNFMPQSMHDNITTINKLPNHDILCAGFPCQSFSNCGKRQGLDNQNGQLLLALIRLLKNNSPPYIIFENVKNLITIQHGQILQIIKQSLVKLGYHVQDVLLNSIDFGLPQYRQRCFIVGCKDKHSPYLSFKPQPHTILKYILQNNVDHKYYLDMPYQLTKSYRTQCCDRPVRIGHINQGRQGERVYSIYGPSITLTSQGGGPAGKTGIYLTQKGIRKLTPRECARLQGFPDEFNISNISDAQLYKQFGNAVSTNIVTNIITQLLI